MTVFRISFIIIVFVFSFFSCINKENSIKNVVNDYVAYLNNDLKFFKRDYLVEVKQENFDHLICYRITSSPNLLDIESSKIPSIVDSIENFKIAYYLKTDNYSKVYSIRDKMKSMGFYNRPKFLRNSNFPVWVFIENSLSGKSSLHKNVGNIPLDCFLDSIKNPNDTLSISDKGSQ